MTTRLIRVVAILLVSYLLMPSLVQARDYDPKTGRFLQRDPESPGQVRIKNGKVILNHPSSPPTNPLDVNPYTYVGNNPLNFVDPFGEQGVPVGVPSTGGVGIGLPPGVNFPLPIPSEGKKGKECPVAPVAQADKDVPPIELVEFCKELCRGVPDYQKCFEACIGE